MLKANFLIRALIMVFIIIGIVGCNNENTTNNINIPDGSVVVYKNAGVVQCESAGMSVEESAQVLINHGIDVISSKCGFITGLGDVMAMCGIGTSDINLHVIHKQNTQDAIELGYDLTTNLDSSKGIGYQVIDCQK